MKKNLITTIMLVFLVSFGTHLLGNTNLGTYSSSVGNAQQENERTERQNYPATFLNAVINNDNDVDLSWDVPIVGEPWFEGFEDGELPEGWRSEGINEVDVTDPGLTGYWSIAEGHAYEGDFSAVVGWSWEPQDEWLITHPFICPPDDLVYWTWITEGSPWGCNYYVKISTDGGYTWRTLQNLSALFTRRNHWERSHTIPLEEYAGRNIQLAWHAVDGPEYVGLYYNWFIDNVSVGGMALGADDFYTVSNSKSPVKAPEAIFDRDGELQQSINNLQDDSENLIRNTRSIQGYRLYRFQIQNENNPSQWYNMATILDPEQTEYTDSDWPMLEHNTYRYAIRVMYEDEELSPPTFSQTLVNEPVTVVTINLSTNSGDSVSGARVSLSNVLDPSIVYTAYAPADGEVVYGNVRRGTYDIEASFAGFENYRLDYIEIVEPTFSFDIELTEKLAPVVDLSYDLIGDNTVVLNWLEPGSIVGNPQWIHWDSGVNNDAIGTGGAAQFLVAARFTPTHIESMEIGELSLTTIKFFPFEIAATYSLRVWRGGSGNPYSPGTLVHSQDVPNPTIGSWNTVELTQPIVIDPTQELWFGYEVNAQGGYPAGTDAGPAVNGLGNLINIDGSWQTLTEVNQTLNFNWNIHGYAGESRGERARIIDATGIEITNRERALDGYKVLRNGTMLAENIGSLTYTDSNVASGTYTYSVIAQYTTGESEAVSTEEVIILSVDEDYATAPNATRLLRNYPNPFNPNTEIQFNLQSPEFVTLEIYNSKGQLIRTLVTSHLSSGIHSVNWDGKDNHNREMGSGIYLYRIKAGSYNSSKKMILMK